MSGARLVSNGNWQRFAHELVHEASGRGMTYTETARAAGVGYATIAKIFQSPAPRDKKGSVISDETAEKIAERLKEALK